ncbi:hypothetical protein V9T40_014011 [Parthenolecanium corni]|uniref:Uncharacterized protein n=1 Tax=Parthenolecanium corni TaxID=536013 RepID=A0AAN9Y367_9HEMI
MQGRIGRIFQTDRNSNSLVGNDQISVKEFGVGTEGWVNSTESEKIETTDILQQYGLTIKRVRKEHVDESSNGNVKSKSKREDKLRRVNDKVIDNARQNLSSISDHANESLSDDDETTNSRNDTKFNHNENEKDEVKEIEGVSQEVSDFLESGSSSAPQFDIPSESKSSVLVGDECNFKNIVSAIKKIRAQMNDNKFMVERKF